MLMRDLVPKTQGAIGGIPHKIKEVITDMLLCFSNI